MAPAPDPAQAVCQALDALFGRAAPGREARGVIHVTATARGAGGRLQVLRVDLGSPPSATDFFLLNLCRARADAILTTAQNLRAEARLSHQLQGPWAPALSRYREQVLGKTRPPACAVLTETGNLPLQHPVWQDGTEKLVLTHPHRAPGLRQQLGSRAEVVELAGLDSRVACAYLQQRFPDTLSVEAGPNTANALYRPPARVDELMLTVCDSALPAALLGNALPAADVLFAGLTLAASSTREEGGVRFRFERWVR